MSIAYRALEVVVSLLPVIIILLALVFLDSYKLLKLHQVVGTMFIGALSAVAAFLIEAFLGPHIPEHGLLLPRYIAPVTEETLKGLCVYFIIRTNKVGFNVDAAILGFAVGAGFAFLENLYYLQSLVEPSMLTWIIRGFGTAVMHGGTTSIMAIITKSFVDQAMVRRTWHYLPGLLIAVIIHSIFNHVPVPSHIMTAILLVTLPALLVFIFQQSEKSTREWLGIGFTTDAILLDAINSGEVSETKVGRYLHTLTTRFPGEVLADMLCMLRIHLELSIRAKGILLLREHGYDVDDSGGTKEIFDELRYLEKSIGTTGMLAMKPFLNSTHRDLWQHYLVSK